MKYATKVGHGCMLCRFTLDERKNGKLASVEALDHHFETEQHRKAVQRRLEDEAMAARLEGKLENLEALNSWLRKLGRKEEDSPAAARMALKRVHINLYDLEAGRFKRIFTNVDDLAEYSRENHLIFPKDAAKADGLLRLFLRPLL